MLIAADGLTVSSTEHGGGEKKKKSDFHYSEKKVIIRTSYSNFDFLIITNKFGRGGSYA